MAGAPNDRELRLLSLRIKDPYDQPRFTLIIPAGAGLIDVVNVYSYERWPKEKVFCVGCGGRRHKHGFTALLTTGDRVPYGSSCGAAAFGEAWRDAEKRMKNREDRQYELQRFDRLQLIAAPMIRALENWSDPIGKARKLKFAFETRLGELASRVREAAVNDDGVLKATRKIAKHAANSSDEKKNDSFEYVTVSVGRMSGAAMFESMDAEAAVRRATAALREAIKAAGPTELISTDALRRQRKGIERAFDDLETVVRVHRGAQRFFRTRNFKTLVEWTLRFRVTRTRYRFEDNAIIDDNTDCGLAVPAHGIPDLNDTPLDLIREYRRAD